MRNVWGFLGRYELCKIWGFFFLFFFGGWLLPMFPLPQMEIGEQRKKNFGQKKPPQSKNVN